MGQIERNAIFSLDSGKRVAYALHGNEKAAFRRFFVENKVSLR